MFLVFTPFSFFFVFVYFLFIFCLFFVSDFFLFWVLIECSNIFFIGVSFSLISFGFSNLMVYFIVQAVASLNILVFYCLSLDYLFQFFLFLNLALFPFSSWYYFVIVKFNNFLFFLSSTFHKFPSFLLFAFFVFSYDYFFLGVCFVFTLIYSFVVIFNITYFRGLIVFSSVGNNVWFLLGTLVSFEFLVGFFIVYSINFLFLLSFLGSTFSDSKRFSFFYSLLFFSLIFSIAGFPPFPIFFFKLYLIFFLLLSGGFNFVLLFFILISVVFIIASYVRYISSIIVGRFGVVTYLLVF